MLWYELTLPQASQACLRMVDIIEREDVDEAVRLIEVSMMMTAAKLVEQLVLGGVMALTIV